jgi:hypothetical protein
VYDNISRNSSYNEKFPGKICKGNRNILCKISFYENHTVHEIKRKKLLEVDSPQIKI